MGLPRVPGNPWVITGRIMGSDMKNPDHPWKIVRTRTGRQVYDQTGQCSSRYRASQNIQS